MESGFQVRNEACTFSQEVGRVMLYLQVVTSALSGSSLRHFKELHRSMCSIPEGFMWRSPMESRWLLRLLTSQGSMM